jgi:hypothetical protein
MKQHPQMTVVFNCNVRRFKGNPHLAETPFGTAQTVGIGNAFEELDEHLLALDMLLDAIDVECRIKPGSLLHRAHTNAASLRDGKTGFRSYGLNSQARLEAEGNPEAKAKGSGE